MKMDYKTLTKQTLIKRLEALERLNQHLIDEKNKETTLQFGWSGNLGHWYWDIPTNTVTFNPLKAETLGYTMEEIEQPVTYQFFTSKLHPDDYDRVMNNMLNHLKGITHVYEVEYRILAKNGEYKWYYDRGSITKRDDQGHPLFLSGIVFDISESKKQEVKLYQENELLYLKSITDELTGILNRRGILDHLKKVLSSSQDRPQHLSVLLLDIDWFKDVNDQYGHLVGDQILKEFAHLLTHELRETDVIGRYGGEEFLIVFPNTTKDDAHGIAERLRQTVAQYTFTHHIQLTFSGGIYHLQGASLYDLINQADINLYEAKRQGKNRIL
jgi:diguanylate cyclase (GGDEF)-like protein/PAS domain S-box-containing protein